MGNIGKIMNRAAFSDVHQKITKYHYGSDAFMRILESRYSCHSFSSYPVSDAKLNMILEAGRLAPSAGNCQPTRIWVVKSEEALARLRADAAIVLTHLMLTATDMGLANMWVWDFDPSKVREALPELKEHGVYALLAIGHPEADAGKPTELHHVRKSIEELVKTL